MKTHLTFLLGIGLAMPAPAAQPPEILNHQGRIAVNGSNFGSPVPQTGHFKFAFLNGNGTKTFWTNNGTNTGTPGGEPTTVSVAVANGHYSLGLGETTLVNMTNAVPASLFVNNPEVALRIWFSTSAGGPLSSSLPIAGLPRPALPSRLRVPSPPQLRIASPAQIWWVSAASGLGLSRPTRTSKSVAQHPRSASAPATPRPAACQLYEITSGNPFGFEFEYDGAPDQLQLWSRGFSGNEAVRTTWTQDGRVGIGTTSPTGTFDELGNIISRGSNGRLASVSSTGTGGKQLRTDSSISSATIDHNSRTYWVYVNMEAEPFLGGGSLQLDAVRIEYATINRPFPSRASSVFPVWAFLLRLGNALDASPLLVRPPHSGSGPRLRTHPPQAPICRQTDPGGGQDQAHQGARRAARRNRDAEGQPAPPRHRDLPQGSRARPRVR